MRMRIFPRLGLLVALALMPTWSGAAELDVADWRVAPTVHGDVAAGREKAQVCNNCHGADGKGPIPNFPSVAGLPEGYLYLKLVAFKNSQRADSVMTPLVANNTIEDLADIAAFYASLPLVAPSPLTAVAVDADVLERGRRLYLSGDPSKGIPPCQGCHGIEGKGPTNAQPFQELWPQLYGQQAIYVSFRLENFQRGDPIDTTADKIMQGVARNMSTDDIAALSAWVERLDGRAEE